VILLRSPMTDTQSPELHIADTTARGHFVNKPDHNGRQAVRAPAGRTSRTLPRSREPVPSLNQTARAARQAEPAIQRPGF